MPEQVRDKNHEPIQEGDYVYTRIRGGRHEGYVDKVVTAKAEAEKEGVKNPPKVYICFFARLSSMGQVGSERE